MFPTRSVIGVTIAGASLTLSGCPQRTALRLAPNSTAASLTFMIGPTQPKPLDVLQVSTCARVDAHLRETPGEVVWRVEGWTLPHPSPRHRTVQYGVLPAGLTEITPAHALKAGCYQAAVMAGGSGSLRFWIDSVGGVRTWTDRELDSAMAQVTRHAEAANALADSAIAQCLGRYRAATAAADTVLIDRWIPVADLLSPFTPTCRDYRRLYWSRFQSRPWAEDSTSGA